MNVHFSKNHAALLLAFALLAACAIDPERQRKDREKLTEYLTQVRADSLEVELDSLCGEYQSRRFDPLVDSLLETRLEEIKQRIKAYK